MIVPVCDVQLPYPFGHSIQRVLARVDTSTMLLHLSFCMIFGFVAQGGGVTNFAIVSVCNVCLFHPFNYKDSPVRSSPVIMYSLQISLLLHSITLSVLSVPLKFPSPKPKPNPISNKNLPPLPMLLYSG